MKWLCSAAVLGALVLSACSEQQAAPPAAPVPMSIDDILPKKAQSNLPTTKLYLGTAELTAELCLDDVSRMTGMMYRTNFPPTHGMLFAFPQPSQLSFWMKNTPVHLSAAYINPEGVIEDIVELKPFDTNSVRPAFSYKPERYRNRSLAGWISGGLSCPPCVWPASVSGMCASPM